DNLATQASDEFTGYRTYDDHRKFTELYTPQRLTSNTIGASSKVVITTIQRLYSMLRGEAELDPALEQGSVFDTAALPRAAPPPVEYNAWLRNPSTNGAWPNGPRWGSAGGCERLQPT